MSTIISIAIVLSFGLLAQKPDARGVLPVSSSGLPGVLRYHLFVIGIRNYIHWPVLGSPINDASVVAAVLRERYGFDQGHVVELYDKEATEANIVRKFKDFCSSLTKQDALLIYYAGHGHLDEETKMGYWIPVDGRLNDPSTWIPHVVIRQFILNMDAFHVFTISDSCFSGDLFVSGNRGDGPRIVAPHVEDAYKRPSRWVMTSGLLVPVPDGSSNGHSVFASVLIRELRTNQIPTLLVNELYNRIRPHVAINSKPPQLKEFPPVSGEPGGEFVFFLGGAGQTSDRQADEASFKVDWSRFEEMRMRLAGTQSASRDSDYVNLLSAWHFLERKYGDGRTTETPGFMRWEKLTGKVRIFRSIPIRDSDFILRIASGQEMLLIWVPDGEYRIGSPSEEAGRSENEPRHNVRLTQGYWLSEKEVTQEQWCMLMQYNPSRFQGRNLPAHGVTYYLCEEFCHKVSDQEQKAGRLPEGYLYGLPTEAQWEVACRAGSVGAYALSNREEELNAEAWYAGNSEGVPHEVGLKIPNRWGFYDMHGNVSEWCSDLHGLYPSETVIDPQGAPLTETRVLGRTGLFGKTATKEITNSSRVFRGGDWNSDAKDCRSASRASAVPGYRSDGLGFRLCLKPRIAVNHPK